MTCPKCQYQWPNRTIHPKKCPNLKCQFWFTWSKDGQHPDVPKPSPQSAPPLFVVSEVPDRIGQLERLANLKQQGILSEEEFEVEKQKILAQT